MKHKYPRLLSVLCALMIATSASWAVPAYRGWQTRKQPDGTTLTIRQVGDEFYHYWETENGKIAAEQPDGTFVVNDEQHPTDAQFRALRKASNMYKSRPRRAIGERNFAPKGLVILVQFANVSFKTANNATAFDNMLNQEGYSYGGATGSAVDYFKAQSNGQYVPAFDVFGPVTLPNNLVYYGEQGTINGSQENDMYIADFVIDAVKAADAAGCDFSKYDSDNDGYVDIVYFFYAGKGQAAGGTSETIWPHNWELASALYYGQTHGNSGYSYGNLPRLDNKRINNYVCSAELKSDGSRSGIGTLCHEFSHVLGLPDYYDTDYGTNDDNGVTPGTWSLMDQGSYNNDEMTPPNYSIYDKYFMGWATPKLLAKDAKANVTMTTGYDDAYQITGSTSLLPYTNTGTIYYIENRQKTGWDAGLPGSGMLVWQVKYNSTAWSNNKPNNTAGNPRCTIVPADGKTKNYGYASDLFPTSSVKSYTPATGCALTEITKSSGNITFKYNGGVSGHDVVINATGCTVTPSATTVENGTGLTATITPTDATYDYTSLTVQLGSTTLTSGTHYTLSADKKTLTIKGTAITGDASNSITITVVWTKNRYSYAMLGENCTEELEGTVTKNAALSLTIAPASGFTLADAVCWDVEMGGTTLTYGTGFTYNSSTNTFSIASVTGDVSILAYGGRSVTWRANGAAFATTIGLNNKIALPATSPDDCTGGKKFVGWCANSSYEHATVAPMFAKAGDTYSVGTYYAVYATQTGSGGASNDYELYNGALTEGDYLLVYDGGAMNTTVTSDRLGFVSVTAANNVITTTEASIIWHIAASGDYWTIYNAGENKYAAGTGAKNKAQMLADGTDDKSLWSCTSTASSETYDFTNKQNTANNVNATLRKNGTYGFACYATGTGGALSLYKNVGGGASYSDYSLTCGELCALSSISLNTTSVQKTFVTGATLDYTGLVVTASYSNCSSKTVNPTSVTVSPSMATAGEKTVTVSYTENSVTRTATYLITVVAPYTVTYKACGDVFATQQYAPGEALELPTETPGGNAEKIFRGWITVEHYTNSSEPTFVTAGGAVNANVTYYAVYE